MLISIAFILISLFHFTNGLKSRELRTGIKQVVHDYPKWITIVDIEHCMTVFHQIEPFQVLNLRQKPLWDKCFIEFECDDSIEQLIESTLRIEVEPNQIIKKSTIPPWHMDRVDQPYLPLDNSNFESFYDANGTIVYIVDTGIKISHQEFEGRAIHGVDLTDDGTSDDLDGHGTHCASLCCGKTYGAAKNATVVNVKVLNQNGEGSIYGIVQGLNWILTDTNNRNRPPSILSMSLGGLFSSTLNQASLAMANQDNFLVFVAAGNEDLDANLFSPASAGEPVITIGAVDANDKKTSFSNYGDKVFIWAPGLYILGAGISSDSSTATLSGTSMATPIAAGIGATIMQRNNGDKIVSHDELLEFAITGVVTNSTNVNLENYLVQVLTTNVTFPPTSRPTDSPTPPTTMSPTSNYTSDGNAKLEQIMMLLYVLGMLGIS